MIERDGRKQDKEESKNFGIFGILIASCDTFEFWQNCELVAADTGNGFC
jgi:hypothetical protein